MSGVLVIVPCGQKKIWDRSPSAGPTAAKDAFIGPPFGINKAYAEQFGKAWVILSAKYGFIDPDFTIAEPYNITFKKKRSGPITTTHLRKQIDELQLDRYTTVIGLGGKEYRKAIELAFAGRRPKLCFPFSGMPIGKAMQATKKAIVANDQVCKRQSHRMDDKLNVTSVSDLCHLLHHLVNGLQVHRFPYDESQIPENGIYVLFEEGELAHGTSRIVRIGTHTGLNQLRSRLKQHFLNEVKDRSIFRKNIGRCLLKQANDPFLKFWELDLTSHAARVAHAAKIDFNKQAQIERQVSEYIQSHLRFVVIEIQEKDQRLALESKLISTVSLCSDCGPSAEWLGRHSPKNKIVLNGLWQVNELRKTPLTARELEKLRLSIGGDATA